MRVQRARGPDDLLVAAVAPGHVDPHGDRLVGLVGDDHALAGLLAARLMLARWRRLTVVGLGAVLLALALALRAPGLGFLPAFLDPRGVALLGRALRALGRLGLTGAGALFAAGRAFRGGLLAR